MGSNFLGDVSISRPRSSVISANELASREGVALTKGLNFRDERDRLSVFLVLERGEGFKDEWNPGTGVYIYEGHDSTTVESGKSVDQLLMYENGRLTENGRFFKAAHAFKDGLRSDPTQVQVYEKLDQGVWYDKGIFNLIDAKQIDVDGKKICKYYMTLADAEFFAADDPDTIERMLSAKTKGEIWKHDNGRCVECRSETGLRFVPSPDGSKTELRCELHCGRMGRGLLD